MENSGRNMDFAFQFSYMVEQVGGRWKVGLVIDSKKAKCMRVCHSFDCCCLFLCYILFPFGHYYLTITTLYFSFAPPITFETVACRTESLLRSPQELWPTHRLGSFQKTPCPMPHPHSPPLPALPASLVPQFLHHLTFPDSLQ